VAYPTLGKLSHGSAISPIPRSAWDPDSQYGLHAAKVQLIDGQFIKMAWPYWWYTENAPVLRPDSIAGSHEEDKRRNLGRLLHSYMPLQQIMHERQRIAQLESKAVSYERQRNAKHRQEEFN